MANINEKTHLVKGSFVEDEPCSNSIPDNSSEVDIDTAMEGAGCGFGTILHCSGPFLFFCFEGAEIVVLSVVGLLLQCDWDLTTFEVSALQVNVMAGIAFASLFFAHLGDRFGRRPVCLVSAIGVTVVGLGCGFADRYWLLFLLRLVVGVFMGTGQPPAAALSGEMTPLKFRALALTGNVIPWGIGASIISGVAYYVVEPYGWRGLMISSALVFSPCILLFAVTGESPRYAVKTGRYEDAEATVRTIYKLNCRPSEGLTVKQDLVVEEGGVSIWRTIKATKNVSNLILIAVLSFSACSSYYSITYSTPRFLNEGYCSAINANGTADHLYCTFQKSVLFDIGIVALAEPVGCLFAVVMVDVVGRRKTFFVTIFLAQLALASLYFCAGYTYLVAALTFTKMAISVIAWIPFLFSAEYFPTVIRSFTVSVVTLAGKIGAFGTIFSAQYVFTASPRLAVAITQIHVAIVTVCLVLLKKETMGAQLE